MGNAIIPAEQQAHHVEENDDSPKEWHGLLWCIWHVPGDVCRYLYFMRFSLLLWLFLPGLALLDFDHGIASVTRGILTPYCISQWVVTGFTIVLPGWFALLAARIVCSYGPERFGSPVPPCFYVYDKMQKRMFLGAQLPGALLLARIAYNVVHEEEGHYPPVIFFLFCGALLALVFWHIVAILYYWTYDPSNLDRARAFLVPKWLWLPLDEIRQLPPSALLDLMHWMLRVLCRLGPGYQRGCILRPGHVVAALTLLCAVILYVLVMPVSAPIAMPHAALYVGLFSAALAITAFLLLLWPALADMRNRKEPFMVRFLPLIVSCVIVSILVLGSLHLRSARAFPVIAYVAILLIVVFWALAGVAFFADHYRIPVLTIAVSLVLLLNLWPAEHVFPAIRLNLTLQQQKDPLPTPARYLERLGFDSGGRPQPVIIVTATGGGIHAAAWTATVLAELEKSFGPEFHQHILLISSVSGGSVASMAFLREYFAEHPFDATDGFMHRVEEPSQCSSLQAVAWGLAYPDALRAVFPWFYNWFSSLDRFDRGWALQVALERNLTDRDCFHHHQDRPAMLPDPSILQLNSLAALAGTLPASLPLDDPRRRFPAFAFNTTVVETGDRFLLANYSAFAQNLGREQILPAASFLGVYGREALLHPPIPDRHGFADISLATAARLSASFTYVSPAARIPFEMSQGKDEAAYHFVDGGYYDNDGTNSVIEFLRSAEDSFPKRGVLPVLLVEIRNSDDIDDKESPDSYANQSGLAFKTYAQGEAPQPGSPPDGAWRAPRKAPGRWGPVAEVLAPPEAAIHAGFNSTTRRNRRELGLLQCAFGAHLSIQRVVFDYQQHMEYKKGHGELSADPQIDTAESEVDQPLSWHLTRRQQRWIAERNQALTNGEKIIAARTWFNDALAHGEKEVPCESTSTPP